MLHRLPMFLFRLPLLQLRSVVQAQQMSRAQRLRQASRSRRRSCHDQDQEGSLTRDPQPMPRRRKGQTHGAS